MSLPSHASLNFKDLVRIWGDMPSPYPHLKPAAVAQWALESGWGKTGLAQHHMNYASLRWWPQAIHYGVSITYADKNRYVHFTNLSLFIEAYWSRFDELGIFSGWKTYTKDPRTFLTFITPPHLSGREPWSHDCGHDPKAYLTREERTYVRDVMNIHDGWTHDLFE